MVYKFFDKTLGSGVNNEIKQNQQLAEELHKPIIRKFKKGRVYSSFKDNIWGADLANIQLISKFDIGIRFLLCVINIFSKDAWVFPLKYKKGVTIVNAFQKILNNSIKLHSKKKKTKKKTNEIWVDKGGKF